MTLHYCPQWGACLYNAILFYNKRYLMPKIPYAKDTLCQRYLMPKQLKNLQKGTILYPLAGLKKLLSKYLFLADSTY